MLRLTFKPNTDDMITALQDAGARVLVTEGDLFRALDLRRHGFAHVSSGHL